VQRLDAPVVADQAGEAFGGAGVGGQVGHAQRCRRGVWSTGRIGDVAFDQPDVVDVRERQVGGCGQDLDGASGDAAVAGVDVAQRDGV
jgi:hypothetical protein